MLATLFRQLIASWRARKRSLPQLRSIDCTSRDHRQAAARALPQFGNDKRETENASTNHGKEANDPDALILDAVTHAKRGDFLAARDFAERALSIAPNNVDAHVLLAALARQSGETGAAIEHLDAALSSNPVHVPALANRGLCLQDLGRYEEARQSFIDALGYDPHNVTVAVNLAGLQFDLGEYAQATARIEGALRQDSTCKHARATLALGLLRGSHFAEGWIHYEARDHGVDEARCRPFVYPEWDGAPAADATLLVCGEQGLGDQIMFASCLSTLSKIAPQCLIDCDPRLVPLLSRSFPEMHVYGHRKGSAQPWLADGLKPAARTWIGDLPLRLASHGAAIPAPSVYLRASESAIERWSARLRDLGPGLKVGISWRGGAATTRRTTRSIPLHEWLPILQVPQVQFISLQYGDHTTEINEVRTRPSDVIHRWDDAIDDFDETAALVCALDLVVTVQTTVAHLAGALGRPAWVFVPKVAEWRYGDTGDRMPWYASVRLFRQSKVDQWNTEINQVAVLIAERSQAQA